MRLSEIAGPISRGLRSPWRSPARAALVVLLLASVTGFLALAIQAAIATRVQIAALDARVGTLIELREAGAFGTGGFGADRPIGHEHFSTETLERVRPGPQQMRDGELFYAGGAARGACRIHRHLTLLTVAGMLRWNWGPLPLMLGGALAGARSRMNPLQRLKELV
jgi:hypothetical protein